MNLKFFFESLTHVAASVLVFSVQKIKIGVAQEVNLKNIFLFSFRLTASLVIHLCGLIVSSNSANAYSYTDFISKNLAVCSNEENDFARLILNYVSESVTVLS